MKQFMEMLKASTAGAHKELENTAISKTIMSAYVDKAAYSDYLFKICNMHQAVEEHVFKIVDPVIQDLNLRGKVKQIHQDLISLNMTLPSVNTFFDEAYTASINFNLGILYVAEGSVLGGQYILKNIRAALDIDSPCEYLKLYGQSTGILWKGFCAQLNNYQRNLTVTEIEEIVSGALYGFERAKVSLS